MTSLVGLNKPLLLWDTVASPRRAQSVPEAGYELLAWQVPYQL